MTTKEHKKYLQDLRNYTKNLLKSKKKTKAFFVRAGIHNVDGSLTENYK